MYWELATGTCLWFTVASQLFGKHIFEQPVAVCTTFPSADVTQRGWGATGQLRGAVGCLKRTEVTVRWWLTHFGS
ncbi:hypothetical protein BC828DRAFT_303364 [Blastocladiella britannica]|nr:hypothetical protein BC828DRAFT_303364 [Blastocladiella britannica]